MPRKPAPPPPASRRRRNADEARTAILDATEKRLAASGPASIRLQEVAADVGVSHPTVLHHFGSREGLVEAVVRRALDSLEAKLLAAVNAAPGSAEDVTSLLDSVFDALVVGGHGRTFLWLALSGYAPDEELRIRPLAEAVHATRRERRAGKKALPPFADTYFTILLPALALLAAAALDPRAAKSDRDPLGPRAFRRWLARLIHEHLDRD
jgi:AcrR family transcriptional regulator